MNIFLTGEKGVGKTTLLNKLLLQRGGLTPGGFFVTRDLNAGGTPSAFYLNDYLTGESCLMARITPAQRQVNPEVFEVFGAAALRRAAAEPIVVLDELGVMEEYAPLFQQAVHETLDRRGNCLVLGVLRLCDGAFVNSVKNRGDVCVYTVTLANRDALLDEIAPLIARVL